MHLTVQQVHLWQTVLGKQLSKCEIQVFSSCIQILKQDIFLLLTLILSNVDCSCDHVLLNLYKLHKGYCIIYAIISFPHNWLHSLDADGSNAMVTNIGSQRLAYIAAYLIIFFWCDIIHKF